MDSEVIPTIVPIEFTKRGTYGDFEWMIERKEFHDSLFIFNDNVEDHYTNRRGAGNAVIRPYNKYGMTPPRSAGIPTGFVRGRQGFKSLTPKVKSFVCAAIQEIDELIAEYGYERLFFSAEPSMDGKKPLLGTSIFVIGDDVRQYITGQIYSLGYYDD